MRSEAVLERGPDTELLVLEFTLSVFMAMNLVVDILPVTGCYMLKRLGNLFEVLPVDTLFTPVACMGNY